MDHVESKSRKPFRICDYENLVYSCTRCNSAKLKWQVLDPTSDAFGNHLKVLSDGSIEALSVEGQDLIDRLHLDKHPAVTTRKEVLELLLLKQDSPDDPRVDRLFRQKFGYPEDTARISQRYGRQEATAAHRQREKLFPRAPIARKTAQSLLKVAHIQPSRSRSPSRTDRAGTADGPPYGRREFALKDPSGSSSIYLRGNGDPSTYLPRRGLMARRVRSHSFRPGPSGERAMGRRKQRKCRICKKSPVWKGGDVKNPGPFCKRCYHKRVWPQRPGLERKTTNQEDGLSPDAFWMHSEEEVFRADTRCSEDRNLLRVFG